MNRCAYCGAIVPYPDRPDWCVDSPAGVHLTALLTPPEGYDDKNDGLGWCPHGEGTSGSCGDCGYR